MASSNPFATEDMAAGYAMSRPPVHREIIRRALRLTEPRPVPARALDIGCGAGLSTQALHDVARHCIGVEPAAAMLQWTSTVAPAADFVVGFAEALPLAKASVDLIAAAGSLNYVHLDSFFPEAARVLTSSGFLLVYDFAAGRSFIDSPALDQWFESFRLRYPNPPSEATSLNPQILSCIHPRFFLGNAERLQISLSLTPEFYLNYLLTETNVAYAVRRGIALSEIRSWCQDTLGPVWQGLTRDVLFHGYFACMYPHR